MSRNQSTDQWCNPQSLAANDEPEAQPDSSLDESLGCGPDFGRREFLQLFGAGLLITVTGGVALGQRGGGRGRSTSSGTVAARVHIGRDGAITVMTGKVEVGQGSRAELTQAAAEELRVAPERIQLIMADTALVPDDGTTAGSQTTPRSVPAVRRGAAAARELLVALACKRWQVDRSAVEVRDGAVSEGVSKRTMSYAELAQGEDLAKAFAASVPADVTLTPVKEWKVMGTPLPRPNRRELVTGMHRYPSDIVRPNMLYGTVLRAPAYGATLAEIDLSPAKAMAEVVVVRDGSFIGCAAPTLFRAQQAVAALTKAASWTTTPQPSSESLFAYLKEHARRGGRGPATPPAAMGDSEQPPAGGNKTLQADYEVSYIQHAPLEPRAAVAEWDGDKLTVWTGSQNPFGVRGELARAFSLPAERIRVIIPDTGGGFGGKHSGEAAIEAARLARAAGRPVCLRWSREEEFTWAYFRPAAAIEISAELDARGTLLVWDYTNINAGGAAVASPYNIVKKNNSRSVPSDAPLRQGSYRSLAAAGNNFARESFMDELALAAGIDPLAFRLAHLAQPDNARLRAVLEAAAKAFGWAASKGKTAPGTGVGLACGTDKGSFVAACAEVAVDRQQGKIKVQRVCQAFECGAIQNPANLRSQVLGALTMGLGGALSEEIRFENGKILTARFSTYRVPRFADVPAIKVQLLDRPDLPSAGAGETPIIAIAPAIANAVCDAVGLRIRRMPITIPAVKPA